MNITLYKKCILSNSYSEVFDVFHKDSNNKVALERYLATLQKYEIIADNVYVPNSGKITLELSEGDVNVYEYNYMYLEDTDNNFRRYCFIDDITVVNGLAVISFSEDIWSNYASSMEIRKSLLSRSRITDYGTYKIPFFMPGMQYESNNGLDIESYYYDDSTDAIKSEKYDFTGTLPILIGLNSVYILARAQIYKTEQEGKLSQREVSVVRICKRTGTEGTYQSLFSIVEAQNIIQDITIKQSTSSVVDNVGGTNYRNYDIVDFILLPRIFFNDGRTTNRASAFILNGSTGTTISDVAYVLSEFSNEVAIGRKTISLPIENDFKRVSIGTFTGQRQIINNGSKINIDVFIYGDYADLKILLNVQNNLIDITRDLTFEVPVSVQTATETQQQKTARELKTLNAKLEISSGALGIYNGIMDVAQGFATTLIGGAIGGGTGALMAGQGATGFNKGFTSGIAGGVMSIMKGKKSLEIANRAMYTTNKAVNIINNAILNAEMGLVIYYVNPDNESEVQANIDETGYVCNEIVDNLFETIDATKAKEAVYNSITFDFVNLYGNFTQDIAKTLRAILCNGFKIWYDETKINV